MFALCFLGVEVAGLLRLAWIASTTRAGSDARLARVYAFHRFYSQSNLNALTRLFSLRFVVTETS